MAKGKVRMRTADVAYEFHDAPGHLDQAIARVKETKLPIVILEHGRAVAAVMAFDELQRLYDVEQRLFDLEESLEDQRVAAEFIEAEKRGEVEWMAEGEFAAFQQQLLDDIRAGKIDRLSGEQAAE